MIATHANDLKKTYAKVAPGYAKTHQGDLDLPNLEKFLAKLPPHAQVLDLGAGNGRDSQWLSEHGCQVTMFDLSPEMLAIARKKVPKATVVQGDMTEMTFEEESFDGVWARASLLHLTKQEGQQVVKKVFEILKPGGIFFCLVKKGEGEKEVADDKYGQPMKRFFSFFQENEMKELLTEARFKSVQTRVYTESSGKGWVEAWGVKK